MDISEANESSRVNADALLRAGLKLFNGNFGKVLAAMSHASGNTIGMLCRNEAEIDARVDLVARVMRLEARITLRALCGKEQI